MPIIESIMSRLNESRFISSVDLKDAFWRIELERSSREKTAFTVPGRPLYQFTRMPFGLCKASQSMCRLMDLVIPSELRGFIFVYIGDLLVVSTDLETHLEWLRIVAESLRKANLTINVDKSKFVMRSIKYLGHLVGNGEIKPDPERVRCITDFPRQTTVKQVRRFLGITGWYQRYIGGYSAIASPVTHPDFSQPFYIQCDASITGVGGVLFLLIEGEEHRIAFMSRGSTASRSWSVSLQSFASRSSGATWKACPSRLSRTMHPQNGS